MTKQQTTFRRVRSIAGPALLGLGAFILYENLIATVVRVRHVLGLSGPEWLTAGLPALVKLPQLWQAYVVAHGPGLHGSLDRLLLSSWPLLLVGVGSILSRDVFCDVEKRDCAHVD